MDPANLRFAKTHEWVSLDSASGLATIGISAFAVEALNDLVYMELPQVGRQLAAGETFGEIESVKAVSDLYAPLAGEIVEVNSKLPDHLELLKTDPYGAGWLIRLRPTNPSAAGELLTLADYQQACAEEH